MGVSGNLEIEPSRTGQNMLEISKGFNLERGWISENFTGTEFGDAITKEVTLDYPLILVCHCPIKKSETIVKLMDLAKSQKRSLLVFSTDLQDDPLTSMIYNAKQGVLNSCAVNIPFMAGKELDYIEDIAVITGSKILNDDGLADSIEEIKLEHLGSAAKVIVGESSTQIVKGSVSEEDVQKHLDTILARIEQEDSKHFKKIMRDRYTRLNQLQATIYVGGSTEAEQGEQRDLIVDSLNSARAALQNGILPGGGAAMFHASKLLPLYTDTEMIEENLGIQIFQSACQEAMKRIISNSVGEEKVGYLIEQIDEKGSYLYGYNWRTHKIEDMYEAGVIDSYKVISSVIEDSVRLATMIIMVEWNVVKKKSYVPTELKEHQKHKDIF